MSEAKTYNIGGVVVTDIKEIKMPMMKIYVKTLGKEDAKWLIETIKKDFPNSDGSGKTHKATFIDVRNAFVRKYFPDLAPKGTTKKASVMKDTLAELEEFLNE